MALPLQRRALRRGFLGLCIALPVALCATPGLAAAQVDAVLRPEYTPTWASAPVLRALRSDFDPSVDARINGDRLRDAILDLEPGDALTVGAGDWVIDHFFLIDVSGTANAPIRIIGEPGARITRSDPWQNVVNFGGDGTGPLRFVLFRGFEITGGGFGLRVRDAEDLWIDGCYIHDVDGNGIAANSHVTRRLFLTRNEVCRTAGTGEGLYIGANNGSVRAYDAVIALNHVHSTGGSQGDGIELKQGSQGCLIAENEVHDTFYPGILCYGSGGGPINVIENNVIWNTQANPFQVQGEALVRGNVVFALNGPAFQSGPHQGEPTNLRVLHNTFVSNNWRAATLTNWGGKPGMALIGNVFAVRNGVSVAVNGGFAGVEVSGNVITGALYNVGSNGFSNGNGLADFVDATWDGSRREVHPHPLGALAIGGVQRHTSAPLDANGAVRGATTAAGAFEIGTYGEYVGPWAQDRPRLRLRHIPNAANVTVRVEGLLPLTPTGLIFAVVESAGATARRQMIVRADTNGIAWFTLPSALGLGAGDLIDAQCIGVPAGQSTYTIGRQVRVVVR